MKHKSLISSIVAISILSPIQVTAATFSKLYAFGDSLSDPGNLNDLVLQATLGTQTFPPSPPYNDGRFTNGQVWVELLAERLNVDSENFAFGGATTEDLNTLDTTFSALPGLPLIGLEQQISQFTFNNSIADPNALYTIWAGANNYLPTNSMAVVPVNNPTIPLMNLQNAVNTLVGIGAKNIMLVNLPGLGNIPATNASLDGVCPINNQFDADCLNDLTQAHNMGLSNLTSPIPDVNLITLDVNGLVDNTIQNPAQFGLTNVTDPCLVFTSSTTFTVCSNPNEYLFWDERHPSAVGHQFIADIAFQSLGIPEPRAIAGLATVGLMAVGGLLKRKK